MLAKTGALTGTHYEKIGAREGAVERGLAKSTALEMLMGGISASFLERAAVG